MRFLSKYNNYLLFKIIQSIRQHFQNIYFAMRLKTNSTKSITKPLKQRLFHDFFFFFFFFSFIDLRMILEQYGALFGTQNIIIYIHVLFFIHIHMSISSL